MAISKVQAMRPALNDVIDALNQITDIEPYITAAVNAWLEAHPEATTTVENGSITYIKLATSLIEWLMSEYDKRALYDSFAPLFTAGAALGIMSTDETDTAAWMERTSTSDGPNMAKSIHGNTVKWNQLIQTFSRSATVSGVTATMNGDGSVTLSGTATAAGTVTMYTGVPITANHKYLISGAPASDPASYMSISGIGRDYGNGGIFTYASDISGGLRYTFVNGQVLNYTIWPQLFDLTFMFGTGNEPTTVTEFKNLYSEQYYPYDAGSLLSVHITGIETDTANGDPLQECIIPVSTYFPNGMRSAGTVYDELTEIHALTRIGSVDLGTLAWVKQADGWFRATENSIKIQSTLVCTKYESYIGPIADIPDKHISATNSQALLLLRVHDSDFTDATTFRTAMNGVMLYYELATPTIVEIDPPLNLIYRTVADGTERVMVPAGEQSAPPTIVSAQGYTADSMLTTTLSTIAPIEGDTASANYAVGSYLMHDNKLCLVVSSIASGEPIVIGQNVTVTTVMAELVRLTQ